MDAQGLRLGLPPLHFVSGSATDHEAVQAHASENVAMLSQHPEYYNQLKSSYDDLLYRQEALGQYLNAFAGRVYHAYSEANERIDLRFVPTEGLCWALDFNVDPMTAIVAQYINGRIHVLKEIYLRNSNTVEMCEQFEQRAASYLQQYHGGQWWPTLAGQRLR
jgi:hypothetical protein